MDLAVPVYLVTKAWPREELYGLTGQARRTAASVAATVAEGYGREHRGSYLQFLRIAQGSLKELEAHLPIADRACIAASVGAMASAESVGKLLRLLLRKLSASE